MNIFSTSSLLLWLWLVDSVKLILLTISGAHEVSNWASKIAMHSKSVIYQPMLFPNDGALEALVFGLDIKFSLSSVSKTHLVFFKISD